MNKLPSKKRPHGHSSATVAAMVRDRQETVNRISGLMSDKRQLEHKVVDYLVTHGMNEYFTVNWKKLEKES
jgi:hypothetical protein